MVEIPFCDVLEILPAEKFRFISTGLTIDSDTENNLCVKAYRLLEAKYDLPPVYMHLRKNIPMGAGLGGGSSDATYVLKGLNSLFDLKITDDELEVFAAELGSDCPFFVKGGTQIATGRGEVLKEIDIDLKGMYLKLINPGIHIGTAEAYGNVQLGAEHSIESIIWLPYIEWQGLLNNSFESYAFEEYPEIEKIKNEMLAEGAIYAAMSGSGSTVFGLYYDEPKVNSGFSFKL